MVLSIEERDNKLFAKYTTDYPVIERGLEVWYPLRFLNEKIMIDDGVELQEIRILEKDLNIPFAEQDNFKKTIKYREIIPETGQPFMVPDLDI
jgi:hypothetical protein